MSERMGIEMDVNARRKWVAVALAGGLLVGGLSGGIALGESEAAMKHEQAMKREGPAAHGAAMSAAELTG